MGSEDRAGTNEWRKVVYCGKHHEGRSDAVQQVWADQTWGVSIANASALIESDTFVDEADPPLSGMQSMRVEIWPSLSCKSDRRLLLSWLSFTIVCVLLDIVSFRRAAETMMQT